MTFDITKQLGAVARTVRNREHEGKPARGVVAAQTYATTAEDLWEAVTSAERLPRWFLPVSGDLRPGGRYQLTGNAGGQILICDPPTHLKVTWEFGGQVSWVDVTIESLAPASSRLTLEHLALVDEHWHKFGPGAAGVGWDMGFMGLAKHLSSGQNNDPAAFMAWMVSDEGKAFMRQSSDGWYRASIASGEDGEVAKGAADRTLAAYTGA